MKKGGKEMKNEKDSQRRYDNLSNEDLQDRLVAQDYLISIMKQAVREWCKTKCVFREDCVKEKNGIFEDCPLYKFKRGGEVR